MRTRAVTRSRRSAPAIARARAIAGALALAGVAVGCSEPKPEPDAVSEHVELYLEDGAEVCAGQVDAYERFIERAFDVWRAGPPKEFVARVHITHDVPCTLRSSCATPGNVWLGQQPEQFHELAHVVVGALDGWSNVALTEGAAEALGPRGQYWHIVELPADVLSRGRDDFGNDEYQTMAVATRFLIERYGIDPLRAFYRAVGEREDPTQGELEQDFELAFGEPLDQAWPILQSGQRCTYELWYCDESAAQPLPLEVENLDCDDPQVAGFVAPRFEPVVPQPTLDPFAPQRVVQFRVESDQRLEFFVEHIHGELIRCGPCADRPPWLYLSDDEGDSTPFELELQAGTYAVVLRQYGEGTARFSVRPAE